MIGEIVDLGFEGEMRKERIFNFWFNEKVTDVGVDRRIFYIGSRDKDMGADLGLIDGFVGGSSSKIGLGDKKCVVGITERSVGVGFDFEDQLTVGIGGDFESLAEFKVSIA